MRRRYLHIVQLRCQLGPARAAAIHAETPKVLFNKGRITSEVKGLLIRSVSFQRPFPDESILCRRIKLTKQQFLTLQLKTKAHLGASHISPLPYGAEGPRSQLVPSEWRLAYCA